jgi:hypothetical protein
MVSHGRRVGVAVVVLGRRIPSAQAFFQDFQLRGCNSMTGDAGQSGTHWGSVVWGVLQVCWGLTSANGALEKSLRRARRE